MKKAFSEKMKDKADAHSKVMNEVLQGRKEFKEKAN
jgi:hypothetical protein